MNLLVKKLKSELTEIIKTGAEPEKLREFFKPKDNLDELVVKCVMFGHYFLPKYFNKPTPEFHYELVRLFFRKGNDYTACPRGFGKTTMNQLCIAFSCVNGLEDLYGVSGGSGSRKRRIQDE